jgi:Arc/MetJ-type ribon-helix-helix transcriptional regulator
MKSGFTDFVATRLIPDHPGQTARWYAREYLQLGDKMSDAKNPEESLANTLDKQVREGKETRVRRERVGGRYRYFPVAATLSSLTCSDEESIVVQIILPKQEKNDINNLVAVDRFKNRNDVIRWLVTEGMKSQRDYLDRVNDTAQQIQQMKKKIASV